MAPLPFGEFELLVRIAAGGMGEVFLARRVTNVGLDHHVAIKRLLPDLGQDEGLVASLIDEANIVSRLNHRNIAQVFDLGFHDGRYFLVMEFLEGRDLRRVMKQLHQMSWPMPIAFAARIVSEAAAGLHHAHELCDEGGEPFGVIHRDVSPHNLFITFEGEIKVLDFGIAKARSRLARTRNGVVKGRVAYVAPERVIGAPHDRRVDVFSLGVVLWETITGYRLFRRSNDIDSLQAIVNGEVPSPSSYNTECPAELDGLVHKALALSPDDRFQSCRDLQEALERFLNRAGYVVTPQRLGRWITGLFEKAPRTVTQWLKKAEELSRKDQ